MVPEDFDFLITKSTGGGLPWLVPSLCFARLGASWVGWHIIIFDVYKDSSVCYKIKPEAGWIQKRKNRSIGRMRSEQEENSHTSFELLIWMHSCLSPWGFGYRGVTEPTHKEIWSLKVKWICPVMGLLNLQYCSCLGRYLGNALQWPQALRCWFP